MSIPNGGLITETNRQYYAGAQQFQAKAQTATNVPTDYVGQTFTSTFDTNLIFSSSDNASNGFNLNNFKIFTSPDANTWTELFPSSAIAKTTGTSNTASAITQVYNKVNIDNKKKLEKMVNGTKGQFGSVANKIMKMISK